MKPQFQLFFPLSAIFLRTCWRIPEKPEANVHFRTQLFQQRFEKQHRVPSACMKIFFHNTHDARGSRRKYCKPHPIFLIFLPCPTLSFSIPPYPLLVIPFAQIQLWITCLQIVRARKQRAEGKRGRERGDRKGGGVNLYSKPCFFPFGLPADSASVW